MSTNPQPRVSPVQKYPMFSLQKPMQRGKYALAAALRVLLLCGVLKLIYWGESQFLPPVSMLAFVIGLYALCSLTAITIRRMRDAGIHSFFLLCNIAWATVVILTCLTLLWTASVTPITAVMTHPALPPQLVAVLCLAGIVLMPLGVGIFCKTSQKKRV